MKSSGAMEPYEYAFVTGCDSKTEWQLKWFMKNYSKHNDDHIIFVDFGVTPETLEWANETFDIVVPFKWKIDYLSWFLKPHAISATSLYANKRVWLDTDCEIKSNIHEIFRYIEPDRLTIAVDRPWTKRRGSRWYNSGVVGVDGVPKILQDWMQKDIQSIAQTPGLPPPGDQDLLHAMLQADPMQEIFIRELPNEYNVLRIQLIDNDIPKPPKIIHWTGHKGNDEIRRQL